MFNKDQFKNKLESQWLGHEFLYFEELPSTNSHLKKIPAEDVGHGMVCLADNQTQGRGQYERNWESSPARNLTFTIAFKPKLAERLHVLTLACAWAAVELIERETEYQSFIKWPNDVLVNNRKIGGLLTEAVFSGNSLDRVLVGIGLNINQESFAGELQTKATSLKLELGSEFERESLLAEYCNLLEYSYTKWHKNETDLLRAINQKLVGYGQWIKLSVNGDDRPEKYKLLGVNEKGELTVINQESAVETFSHEQIRLLTD